MKKLTQIEFENQIIRILDGQISRKKLAKELETDLRTLHGKIVELAQTNPELYQEYVKKFSYQQKNREDIDFEALVIEMMKQKMSLDKVASEYNVSIRTISRRIRELEKNNPELISIYREYANYLKTGQEIPIQIQNKIDELEARTVVIAGINQNRERNLREQLEKFEALLSTGISKAEAAKRLGYDNYPTIWKMYRQLERIETEKDTTLKSENNNTKEENFRESMKVTNKQVESIISK